MPVLDGSVAEHWQSLLHAQPGVLQARVLVRQPAEPERFATYGPVTEMAQQFTAGRRQALSSSDAPNPQEVADVIARVIDTPAGERPLRSPVGQNMQGVFAINETASQVQTGLLGALGLTAMLHVAPAEEAG